MAARVSALQEDGRNPFAEYQVPEAVLALKQGFGRLIRAKTDRGVLAILDNRIQRMQYGKIFLESLPRYRRTHDLRRSSGSMRQVQPTNEGLGTALKPGRTSRPRGKQAHVSSQR